MVVSLSEYVYVFVSIVASYMQSFALSFLVQSGSFAISGRCSNTFIGSWWLTGAPLVTVVKSVYLCMYVFEDRQTVCLVFKKFMSCMFMVRLKNYDAEFSRESSRDLPLHHAVSAHGLMQHLIRCKYNYTCNYVLCNVTWSMNPV